MTAILLDLIYAAGLLVSSPVWVYRMIRHGRYRTRLNERFGAAPIRYGLQPVIWIHAVSVGEANAATTLVQELHGQLPDYRIVISSTTDTGITRATKLFSPDHVVFQWPMDFSWSVRRAIGRVEPEMVVLIEGEVWPNFLATCNKRDIPVVIVNARMSADKGYPRYRLLGPLAGKLFNRLAGIGVQDETYAQRYIALGVEPSKVHLTGMMKFDTSEAAESIEGADALATALGITGQDQLIVAGGTGPGEERILLDVFAELTKTHPRAKLTIVPRKLERFDEAARLITAAGFQLIRRSERPDGASGPTPDRAVILGDTMGELRKFYSLGCCVFVGRSLVPMGGSDMIEAAALGKPTAFGPHTFNFPQADALVRHGCVRVTDGHQLRAQLDAWLSNPDTARQAGRDAQQYVISQKGATKRNVEMICRLLGRIPAAREGAIATDVIAEDQKDKDPAHTR